MDLSNLPSAPRTRPFRSRFLTFRTTAQLDEWYRVYLETMRRNFVPARSRDFFHTAWEILRAPGYMRLLLAGQQPSGRIIGGTVLLSFKANVFAAFAASSERDYPLHPNDLLHWVAIHDLS